MSPFPDGCCVVLHMETGHVSSPSRGTFVGAEVEKRRVCGTRASWERAAVGEAVADRMGPRQ